MALSGRWQRSKKCAVDSNKCIHFVLLIFVSCSIISYHSPANAITEKRVALVIGNSDYKVSPLRNPTNDATDVAQVLSEELGFDTTLVIDADQAGIRRAIRDFSQNIKTADVRLFYYAGHGVSIDGVNYMIPIGASISNEDEVQWEAVDTSLVLSSLEKYNTGANVMILDACRDNPLPRSTRSGSRGLAELDAPIGSLILYATAPGEVALDGLGRNGTFTKHLLRSLAAPNLHIGDLALDVRVAVMQETDNQQVPWSESSLTRRIYLAGKTGESVVEQQLDESTVALIDVETRTEEVLEAVKEQPVTATASASSEALAYDETDNTQGYEASIIDAYLSAAEAGDAIAQASVGYIYDVGRSVTENDAEAYRWYSRAVDQAQLDAMVNLAGLYLRGDGVERDADKSYLLNSTAAHAGHATAQRNLGVLYQFGEGIEQDFAAARIWFEKAAEQGQLRAFVDLGDLYSRGLGVSKNEEVAFAWYLKAAKNGSADAQSEVGYYYDEGLGVDQDYASALDWFQKAADQDHPTGIYNLAEAYEKGKGVSVDLSKAVQLYERAAQAGVSLASEALERLK